MKYYLVHDGGRRIEIHSYALHAKPESPRARRRATVWTTDKDQVIATGILEVDVPSGRCMGKGLEMWRICDDLHAALLELSDTRKRPLRARVQRAKRGPKPDPRQGRMFANETLVPREPA